MGMPVPQISHCSLLGLQQLESWERSEPAGLPSTSEMEYGPCSCGGIGQLPGEAGIPTSCSIVFLDTV